MEEPVSVAEAITVSDGRQTRRRLVLGGLVGGGAAAVGLARAERARADEPTVFAPAFVARDLSTSPTKIQISYSGDPHGSIEMGNANSDPLLGAPSTTTQVPFIDFHFAKGGPANSWPAQDYNVRIQNLNDGQLTFLFVPQGSSTTNNVNFNNGAIYTSQSAGSLSIDSGTVLSSPDLTKTTKSPFAWAGTLPQTGFGSNGWPAISLVSSYQRTDAPSGFTLAYIGVSSNVNYGTSTIAPKGTTACYSAQQIVSGSGDVNNEQGMYLAFLRYDNGTNSPNPSANPGRAWLMDLNLHGAIGTQQGLMNGISAFLNNYYNGDPVVSESANIWVMTKPGSGGGGSNDHYMAQTYPLDNGIAIVGSCGTGTGFGNPPVEGTRQGFKTGIRIGGTGGPWGAGASRFGTGISIRDYENVGINFPARFMGSTATAIRVPAGSGEVLAQGGLVTKTKVGAPTDLDVDNKVDGHLIVDTVLNRLWVRSNGSWKFVALN